MVDFKEKRWCRKTLFDNILVSLQVKSGTLFDNVLVSDDLEYAKKLAEETWGKHKDAEKVAFDEAEKKREEEVLFINSPLLHDVLSTFEFHFCIVWTLDFLYTALFEQ
ncbi:unnamed protein product [Coffea canephora]|uniref:Calreticulin n=1 Tax=Coffea canephora TaxID=49390 RepID=A0A068VF92_COFCA|nr:unnamed protein product [Coffea canephora]